MERGFPEWFGLEAIFENAKAKHLAAAGLALAITVALSFGIAAQTGFGHEADTVIPTNVQQDDASEASVSDSIAVHISGSVKNPGVYELDQGSRVVDAVNAAGGLDDDAAEASVNMARLLTDGEHIVVQSINQVESQGDSSARGQAGYSPLISINTASKQELCTLPGIGEATASKIVAYRDKNGPYAKLTDLMRVSGIGQAKFDSIADLICL